MSVAIDLVPNKVDIIDTLWTMLKPFDTNVRLALGKRLIESAKVQDEAAVETNISDKIRNYVASPFIESLPVSGGEKVPEDENGMDALLEMKYGV